MIYDLGNRLHLRIDHHLAGQAVRTPFGTWRINIRGREVIVADDKPAAYERLQAAELRSAER